MHAVASPLASAVGGPAAVDAAASLTAAALLLSSVFKFVDSVRRDWTPVPGFDLR